MIQKYHPFSKIYLLAIIALLGTAIAGAATDGEADVRLSMVIILIAVTVLQWLFLIVVAYEITTILKIRIFCTK